MADESLLSRDPAHPEPEASRFEATVFARPMSRILLPLLLQALVIPLFLLATSTFNEPAVGVALIATIPLLLLAIVLEARARVVVGSDGVLITRRGRRRFHPFAALAEAREVEGVRLQLVYRGGEVVELYTGREENAGKEKYQRRCAELLARIQEGIARAAAAQGAGARVAARIEAAAGASVTSGYRIAEGPSREELWEAVADGAAPPVTRAAAARALRGDEGSAPRLLRIAEATAQPELSTFLRIAADPAQDEAAIAEALSALDEEAPRRRLER